MTAEPLSDETLLARLVAFDTTSDKSNRGIADFISDYLDRPGVRLPHQYLAGPKRLLSNLGHQPVRSGLRGELEVVGLPDSDLEIRCRPLGLTGWEVGTVLRQLLPGHQGGVTVNP